MALARIAHLSDLHFGAHDPGLVQAGLDLLQSDAAIRAVAITGDLTQKGRHSEFAQARCFIAQIPAPVVMVPGNHDTPYYNLWTRWRAPFARYERYFSDCSKSQRRLVHADLGGLNSARGMQRRWNWSQGAIDLAETEGLARQFEMFSCEKARLFLAHHPLIDRDRSNVPERTRNGTMAAARLAQARIDLILTGHTHAPLIAPLQSGDGLTYQVHAGTAFSTRLRGAPASLYLIDIHADHFAIHRHDALRGMFTLTQSLRLPRRPAMTTGDGAEDKLDGA
jgi:3',5'-cyclic AMP phosphodiesterase CpdA